ncbi:MAG: efflux RND transporter periplasmic adaptor subunit [Bacteroidaceae bacterium]|nr:efflux RND transporter periplasmic adaptor subunit [Bacteroidaceae bacterium]
MMKRIFCYIFAAFAAVAVASCGHSHDGHSHEAHSHDAACDGHSHDGHSHEAHSHDAACDGHSHDDHSHDGHSHEADAHKGENSSILHFAKEQQQKIDFAIEKVQSSDFNGAVKVAARVASAPSNLTTIIATNAGRLHYVGNIVEGKSVSAGESLFSLDGSNVTENDAAVKFAEAESNYTVAKADYERKVALFKDNIVSQKELQAAEAALRQAEAHYYSMKNHFSNGKMVLKAPMGGYISTLFVENGDYVAAGTAVAAVQRGGEVNIEAELPVRYAAALTNISAANIELSDGTIYSLDDVQGRVVAVGRAANDCSMIPVTVSAKLDAVVPGSIVTLHLAMSLKQGDTRLVVPRTALIEEMGVFYVFVHKGGDAFEKREVRIGATDGKYTQIIKGLHKGESVVAKGAISLKLSQGAAALDPHAGHVH